MQGTSLLALAGMEGTGVTNDVMVWRPWISHSKATCQHPACRHVVLQLCVSPVCVFTQLEGCVRCSLSPVCTFCAGRNIRCRSPPWGAIPSGSPYPIYQCTWLPSGATSTQPADSIHASSGVIHACVLRDGHLRCSCVPRDGLLGLTVGPSMLATTSAVELCGCICGRTPRVHG